MLASRKIRRARHSMPPVIQKNVEEAWSESGDSSGKRGICVDASRPDGSIPGQHSCVNLNAGLKFQGQHNWSMPVGDNPDRGAEVEVSSNFQCTPIRPD